MLTTYLLNSLQNSTPVSRENRKWTLVTPNVDLIFRSVCFLYCSGIVCLLWLFSILNFIHFESIFALKNFFPIAYDFTRYCSEWKGHFTEWRSSAGGRKKKKTLTRRRLSEKEAVKRGVFSWALKEEMEALSQRDWGRQFQSLRTWLWTNPF